MTISPSLLFLIISRSRVNLSVIWVMDRVISDRFSILYNLISSCVNVDGLKSSVHFGLWNWIKDYDEDLESGFKILICFWFTIFGLLVSSTDFWFFFGWNSRSGSRSRYYFFTWGLLVDHSLWFYSVLIICSFFFCFCIRKN